MPTGSGIAPAAVGGGNGRKPGFAFTMVPLAHSFAPTILELVCGFLSDADGVRVDAARKTDQLPSSNSGSLMAIFTAPTTASPLARDSAKAQSKQRQQQRSRIVMKRLLLFVTLFRVNHNRCSAAKRLRGAS